MLDYADALFAGLVAAVVTAACTPLATRLSARLGAVDEPRARGLSDRPTPRLGGVAILGGVLLAMVLFVPAEGVWRAVLGGALLITLVGVADDVLDLPPALKLAGQTAAALLVVLSGVSVETFTFPFLGRVELGDLGAPLTLLGLVGVMNVVNFSDGVDGLAAGVCGISAIAFAVIAFDLGKEEAAVLAAVVAGAAAGFLVHNFHPASVFMGDSGSNLLGLLLGVVIVEGTLKTNALIALIGPLVVLAVPFLDTGFVLAKRIKYGRPVYRADRWHFHHRLANIGFSQRRTVLYLYAWTLTMAGLAVALRFVPYSESSGRLNPGWAAVMVVLGLLAAGATVYLVYVLEILKLRRLRAWQMRRASAQDVDAEVRRELETGEFDAVGPASRAPVDRPRPDAGERADELVEIGRDPLHQVLVEGSLAHPGQGEGGRGGRSGDRAP